MAAEKPTLSSCANVLCSIWILVCPLLGGMHHSFYENFLLTCDGSDEKAWYASALTFEDVAESLSKAQDNHPQCWVVVPAHELESIEVL